MTESHLWNFQKIGAHGNIGKYLIDCFIQLESHPVVCGLNKIPKAKEILAVHVKEVGMYPRGGTWMQGANSCLIAMCPPAPS